MELSMERLCKHFGSKAAVNEISVTLRPGVYGLMRIGIFQTVRRRFGWIGFLLSRYHMNTVIMQDPIGGLTFDVVTVRMLLYAAVTLICVPFARKGWKGHQVV